MFDPLGGGSPTFGGRGETKTQRIAMKFGMLVIGLGENHMPIDDLAQTKMFFYTRMITLQRLENEMSD